MNAGTEAVGQAGVGGVLFDFEVVFHAQYGRIARVIARVVDDPSRAEELAVEVFWKLWRNPQAQAQETGGWLYRTAVRMGLDELRKQSRRARYEVLAGPPRALPNPEEARAVSEERERVRAVLARIPSWQAELLILRSDGLSYIELATALDLNPASVGTLLNRAQQAFRKEYVKRYGQHG